MSAIMMIEIVVGIVILAVTVRFAVRETRRLHEAEEAELEPLDTEQAPEHDREPVAEHDAEPGVEHDTEPVAEHDTAPEEPELSEVSATEAH